MDPLPGKRAPSARDRRPSGGLVVPTPAKQAAVVMDGERVSAATSLKLDYTRTLAADPRIPSRAFEVGFAIIQGVDWKSDRDLTNCTAKISDEALSDHTGRHLRDVFRARQLLKENGWVTWKRTTKANVYTPLYVNVDRLRDYLTAKSEARKERREKNPKAWFDRTSRVRFQKDGSDSGVQYRTD